MKTIKLKFLMLMSTLGMASATTSQAYGYDFTDDAFCYNIISEIDRTVAIVDYCPISGKGHLTIYPNTIYESKSYSVTTIGDRAFYLCKALTSVDIPNSVTTIGDYAFGYCN